MSLIEDSECVLLDLPAKSNLLLVVFTTFKYSNIWGYGFNMTLGRNTLQSTIVTLCK